MCLLSFKAFEETTALIAGNEMSFMIYWVIFGHEYTNDELCKMYFE